MLPGPVPLRCALLRLAVMLAVLAPLGAGDAYLGWRARVDADLAAAAAGAARPPLRAARLADPPPAGAGGIALAHQRLVLAWLDGAEHAGGHLAAVRRDEDAVLALVDAHAAPVPIPGLDPAGAGFCAAAFADLGGPVASWAGRRGAGLADECAGELHRRRESAARRAEGRAADAAVLPPPAPADRQALVQGVAALRDPDDEAAKAWSAHDHALAWRVASTCPAPYAVLAQWQATGAGWTASPRAAAEESIRRLRQAMAVMRDASARLRPLLPLFDAWAARRSHARAFGWTDEATALAAILRLHLEDPATASRADARFLAAVAVHLRQRPWPPDDQADLIRAADIPPVATAGDPAPVLADWAAVVGAVSAWSARNAATGSPLAGWDATAAAAAHDAFAAMRASIRDAVSGLSLGASDYGLYQAVTAWLDLADQAMMLHRAGLAAGPTPAAGERLRLRDRMLARLRDARINLAGEEAALASIAGAPVPSLPLALGLGEQPAPGGRLRHEADPGIDAALRSAAGPAGTDWAVVAERLIAIRRAGAEDPGRAWQRLTDRLAACARLAGDAPDRDLLAADLVHDGAATWSALLRLSRAGQDPPRPLAEAVAAWIAAARRPGAATLEPPAGRPDPVLAAMRFRSVAGGCAAGYPYLAARLIESDDLAGARRTLAEQEAFTALPTVPPEQAEEADAAAYWLRRMRHTVAAAYVAVLAVPDPGSRRRSAYLAAARTWIADSGLPEVQP